MPKDLHEQYNYREAIFKVLKQVHPDTGITSEANNEINLMLHFVIERLLAASNQLVDSRNARTITARIISHAVRLQLVGEVHKHAISEGTKAVTKFSSAMFDLDNAEWTGTKRPKHNHSKLAGLTFPVGRTNHLIRHYARQCYRVSQGSVVFLTAVIEYLAAEILELAGNHARNDKRTRITTQHIMKAIRNDNELHAIFKRATLSGGVLPDIAYQLLPHHKQSKPAIKSI